MWMAKRLFSAFSKAIEEDFQEQRRIKADWKVVEESLEISRTSAKPETRISRMGVAITRLAEMCQKCPQRPDVPTWSKQGLELVEAYPAFIVTNLSELISGEIAKIERLKSQSARHNRAEKLIQKLVPYFPLTACDKDWLTHQIFLLKKAYPPEGTTPELEVEIPTLWEPPPQGVDHPPASSNKANHVKTTKPLSWFGKLGIWFLWAMLCAPGTHKGDAQNVAALVISIVMAVVTVKWINMRRESSNATNSGGAVL